MTIEYHSNQRQSVFRWGLLLAAIFIIERLALLAVGVRFNVDALSWYWQVLDPILLGDNLLESLYFLHAQPPFFNLLIGVVLKMAPFAAPMLLHGIFLAMGLVLALTLFIGLVELGWAPRSALLAVSVGALTPGWIVYENWLFYDFPVMVLIALALVALIRYGRTALLGSLGVFLVSLVAVALTRSLFHLVWLAVSVGILIAVHSRLRTRRALVVVLMPVVLTAGWYGKNQIVFGFFGSSSWLGLSLAKTATARMPPAERDRLVSSGDISPFASVKPFSPLDQYEAAAGITFEDSEIGVLGQRIKSTGHPNFNHLGYLEVSNRCASDAVKVIASRPGIYANSVRTAVRRFFSSAVAYPPFLENLMVIAPIFRLGEITWSRSIAVTGAYFSALAISVFGVVRGLKMERPVKLGSYLWVAWTLVWVLIIGSLVEVGENHRFRFLLTPLIWLTLADGGRQIWCRLQRND